MPELYVGITIGMNGLLIALQMKQQFTNWKGKKHRWILSGEVCW